MEELENYLLIDDLFEHHMRRAFHDSSIQVADQTEVIFSGIPEPSKGPLRNGVRHVKDDVIIVGVACGLSRTPQVFGSDIVSYLQE